MFEKISVCNRQSREAQIDDSIGLSELFFEISSEDPLKTDKGFERITWSLFSKNHSHHKNGSHSRAIRLQSSGSLFVVRGRTIYYVDGLISKVIPFEICLDDARTIESFQDNKTTANNDYQSILRNQSSVTIMASNFPTNVCPISKLTLTFVIGEHYTDDTGHRPVLLCKGKVEMDETVKSYIPGSKPEGVQLLFDHITLLSSQIDLPVTKKKNSLSVAVKNDDKIFSFDYLKEIPKVSYKIFILMVLVAIIWQPFKFFDLINIPSRYLWIITAASYIFQIIRALLLLIILILLISTPVRWDFLQDLPVYLSVYMRSYLNLNDNENGSGKSGSHMSFYVHGWNAWGFCGTVKQGNISYIKYLSIHLSIYLSGWLAGWLYLHLDCNIFCQHLCF